MFLGLCHVSFLKPAERFCVTWGTESNGMRADKQDSNLRVAYLVTGEVEGAGGREPSALGVPNMVVTRVQRKQGSASSRQCAMCKAWETCLNQGIKVKDKSRLQLHCPMWRPPATCVLCSFNELK